MYSDARYPIAGWVAPFGYPRINACSRLPMAFRSVPRPSSPPGAKASTECPSRAHSHRERHSEASASPPCTGTIQPVLASVGPIPIQMHASPRRRLRRTIDHVTDGRAIKHITFSLTPLNTLPAAGTCTHSRCLFRSDIATAARPETHQNLIHTDKEQQRQPSARADRTHRATIARDHRSQELRSMLARSRLSLRDDIALRSTNPDGGRSGSNRRPPACKAGALPAELRPQETIGMKLAQLSERTSFFETRTKTPPLHRHHCPAKHAHRSWWAREDLNLRPHAYQACALTS